MFGGEHWHLVVICTTESVLGVRIVTDNRLHGLLVIFSAIVAVDVVGSLDVNDAGTLTQFSCKSLLHLIFVEAWRAIVRVLHLRETATLGTGLGDRPLSILVLLVHQLDLRLQVLVRLGSNLGDFVD